MPVSRNNCSGVTLRSTGTGPSSRCHRSVLEREDTPASGRPSAPARPPDRPTLLERYSPPPQPARKTPKISVIKTDTPLTRAPTPEEDIHDILKRNKAFSTG